LIHTLHAVKKIFHAKPQRREGAKNLSKLFAPSLLCEK
jgi:hypothetical protein